MDKKEFDLIIIGGGISASLMSISLSNKNKNFRIAIIERSTEFPQKVGESTSDITALFLHNLQIDDLLKKYAGKAGLRFLFNENKSSDPEQVAEFSSPTLKTSIPGFHLNRKLFDEEILMEAERRGATVFRPSTILSSALKPFDYNFEIEFNQEKIQLRAERILDASGRFRFLKEELSWNDADIELNTGSIMAHFKGVNTNVFAAQETKNYWKKNALYDISYSTLHLMRPYSWWWLIKVDDETTSIGMVYDKTKITIDDPKKYFNNQLKNDPELAVIVNGATKSEIKVLDSVAYCSEKLVDKGASVIGDSGAFCDPLISPGIELICQQVLWLTELYLDDFKQKSFNNKKWSKYEKTFLSAYDARISLHSHLYNVMEYYDLMADWLRLTTFSYFAFYVHPSVVSKKRLKWPVQIKGIERVGFNLKKRRMNAIVKKRREKNYVHKRKPNEVSFSKIEIVRGNLKLATVPIKLFLRWLWGNMKLELRHITKK